MSNGIIKKISLKKFGLCFSRILHFFTNHGLAEKCQKHETKKGIFCFSTVFTKQNFHHMNRVCLKAVQIYFFRCLWLANSATTKRIFKPPQTSKNVKWKIKLQENKNINHQNDLKPSWDTAFMHAENACTFRANWAKPRLFFDNQGKKAQQCVKFSLGIFLFENKNTCVKNLKRSM